MNKTEPKTFIRIVHDGDIHYVEVVRPDFVGSDSVFRDCSRARQRAEVLAKLYGCEWKDN